MIIHKLKIIPFCPYTLTLFPFPFYPLPSYPSTLLPFLTFSLYPSTLYPFTGAPVHQCTCAPVHLCTGARGDRSFSPVSLDQFHTSVPLHQCPLDSTG